MRIENNEVCVWYLYHSGFAVKTSDHILVFDYFMDNPNGSGSSQGSGISSIPGIWDSNVVVFASHRHSDHYNPSIFEWKKKNEDIGYVLSDDIRAGRYRKDALQVHTGHAYSYKGVDIEVFDSTDIGVSFLVKCGGIVIFHAGDLNWWHWKGEPDDENNKMAENYKKQIDLLKGRQVDLAFIPADPRLEEYYILGLDYFMRAVGAEKVFPMHFGNDYSVFQWLKKDPRAAEYINSIVEITPLNHRFVY